MFVSSTKWNFILAYENKLDKEFRELEQQNQNRYLGSGQRKRYGKLTLLIMWSLYEIIHICTAVLDESEEWSSQSIFQFMQLERRSLKKSALTFSADYLCCLPIFPARLLICSRTSISYTTRIGERSFSSLTSDLLAGFSPKQNWAVLTDERICALMKRHVLLAIQGKLKLAKSYYFSVAIGPRTKSWQTCGKGRKTLKLWNAAISKYIQLIFLLCCEKAIDLQHIYNLDWRNVEFSCKKKRNAARSW